MKHESLPIVSTITRAHGKGSIMALGDPADRDLMVTSTGCFGLDLALGVGGYPHGRLVEVYGPAEGGKMTLALHAIASAQSAGQVVAFVDVAHSFDIAYACALGVDTAKLLVSQPDNGEQALDILEMLTRSGAVGLIVVSSTEDLSPKAVVEGEDPSFTAGLQARMMSQKLRTLTTLAYKTGTVVMFLSGVKARPAGMEPEWASAGNNALKFYASVRIEVRSIGDIVEGENVVGARHRIKVVKNKVAPPFREALVDIRWDVGVDRPADLFDLGVGHSVIAVEGGLYSFKGAALGRGRVQAVEGVAHLPEGGKALREAILDAPYTRG